MTETRAPIGPTHMIGLESLAYCTDIRVIEAPVKPLPDFLLPSLSVSLI